MFKPVLGRILVKPTKKDEKVTSGGIVLPGSASDEKALRGVVTVSTYDDPGVGSEILYSKFGYDEAEVDGELFHVVSLTNILGTFS